MMIALVVYQTLVLAGGADFSALVAEKLVLRKKISTGYHYILGLALLPVWISYMGFAGAGRIPYLIATAGVACALRGIWLFIGMLKSFSGLRRTWGTLAYFIVPAAAIVSMAWARVCYVDGGINNIDDVRSLILTGSFATNFLKPAYPFNFAIPISYNYYAYETCAFLYSSVAGHGFPAQPLFVYCLAVIAAFYFVLFASCEELYPGRRKAAFLLTSLFVTFYGFDFLHPEVFKLRQIDWWNEYHIDVLSDLFNWSYQYVFSSALLVAGVFSYRRFRKSKSSLDWNLFAIFFLLAGGHAAIPFTWAVLAMFLAFAIEVSADGLSFARLLLKRAPVSAGLVLLILAPQVFTFVGRHVIFGFSAEPHTWFARLALTDAFGSAVTWPDKASRLWLEIKTSIEEVGPFIALGAAFAVVDAFSKPRRRGNFFPLNWFVVAAFILMTFTTAKVFDWFTRGNFTALVMCAFFAAELFLNNLSLPRRRGIAIAIMAVLLAPQIYNFFLEPSFRHAACEPVPSAAARINAQVPFGSVFYSHESRGAVVVASSGRAMLEVPTDVLKNDTLAEYTNTDEFLRDVVSWDGGYLPCTSTKFGGTTPAGWYYDIPPQGNFGDAVLKQCP